MAPEAPGRVCGECTVCCTALVVDTPEFRKLPGVTCAHCTSSGCAIYATRFPICRSYLCGWIQTPELGDEWRPDRSGMILTPQTTNIPAEFEIREGVELLAVGGESAIGQPAFAPFVLNLVVRKVPVYLAVPGPEGHYPARALLNRPLAPAAEQRDVSSAREMLLQIFRSAKGHTFEPVAFES